MKRVTTFEVLKGGESLGWSCLIKMKGCKAIGIISDGEIMVFPTEKEAHKFGRNYDVTNVA
jgi:hypothetical protein